MFPHLSSVYRSHTCGELRPIHLGQKVTLSGWIHRQRDHGGVLFVDLRDHYGITQVVVRAAGLKESWNFRVESVICVTGSVLLREAHLINAKLETGEIELLCEEVELLSGADVLPLQIADDDSAPENIRLRYRFLDLRRGKLHRNIMLRAAVIKKARELMHELGFNEFQTPILTSSSPEGARDFLVPSRFYPGKFFALPQAPQQFKQLLMVAGFDRYFQIAPCFRDEDPRADRSPGEFYQLDIEMSFVEQEDVFYVGDHLLSQLFQHFTNRPVSPSPFVRIPFDVAMQDFGTDKPDLRNPLRIRKVTSAFLDCEFEVFKGVIADHGHIFAIALPPTVKPSRKYFDDTVELFRKWGDLGLSYIIFEEGGCRGSIAKHVTIDQQANLRVLLNLESAQVVFLAAGNPKLLLPPLGRLRSKLGEDFSLLNQGYHFCWVTDFPMYEFDAETSSLVFSHNPFSMPQGGLKALEEMNPLDIKAFQYDIVCNGCELSSGAIRNHKPEVMYKAFEIAGYTRKDVDDKFGGMIRAFQFGAPPHGGFAPGIDRIVMLLAEQTTIREVIAFPMAQTVEDLLMGAPSVPSERALREAHIQVVLPDGGASTR